MSPMHWQEHDCGRRTCVERGDAYRDNVYHAGARQPQLFSALAGWPRYWGAPHSVWVDDRQPLDDAGAEHTTLLLVSPFAPPSS